MNNKKDIYWVAAIATIISTIIAILTFFKFNDIFGGDKNVKKQDNASPTNVSSEMTEGTDNSTTIIPQQNKHPLSIPDDNMLKYLGVDIKAYSQGSYYEEYDGGSGFQLGGSTYNRGFTIGTYSGDGYANFNLNGDYNYLSGLAGNVDGVNYTVSYNVLGDGELIGTIDIEGGGLPTEFEFDVKGVRQLSIVSTGDSNYGEGVGFADVVVSDEKHEEPLTPKTENLKNAYLGKDIKAYTKGLDYEEYDGISSFQLGGVAYSKGFTIGTYSGDGYANFNLNGDYNYLSGLAGNVDGVNYTVTYNVLGDGELIGTIDIEGGGLPTEFEFDVKGVRQLSIVSTGDSNYGKGVGFADVVVSDEKHEKPLTPKTENLKNAYLGKDIKAYTKGLDYEEYDGISSFQLGGVAYSKGFTIGTYSGDGYANFNLNGDYNYLSGLAGNVDGVNYTVTYNVLGDGELIGTIDIEGGGLPTEFEFDVKGVRQLSIVSTGDSNYGKGVGFADVVVSDEKHEKPLTPKTENLKNAYLGKDIKAYTKGLDYEEYDGISSFQLGGVAYSKGFTIGTYSGDGYANFNLNGDYNYLSGLAGNVDGVNYTVTYNVLGDGELIGTIDIEGGGLPTEFEFDVKGVRQLSIVSTGDSNYGKGVGFADPCVWSE